jgi:hypothetical protein
MRISIFCCSRTKWRFTPRFWGSSPPFALHPYHLRRNLLLTADVLARTYGKLPHEILFGSVEAMLVDLEALFLTRQLAPPEGETPTSLTEQIKRKRRELGLIV